MTSATTLGPPGTMGMGAMGQGAQVVVQWERPAVNGASVSRYDVQYRQQGTESWTSASHDGVISMGAAPACGANLGRCAVISSLDASGTTYEARVRAVNSVCDGEWSEVTSATTQAVPDSPVITSIDSGNAKLTVNWQAPADHGNAVTDYDVRYRALPNGDWTDHAADANDDTSNSGTLDTATTLEVTGLSGGTMYAVQVRAQNSVGESAWSLAVVESTPAQAGAQAQAFGQASAQSDPAPPADPPADQPSVDPPTLIGLFNDASIANGSTVALDMADYFSGDDLLYTVEVTTTNQRTGQSKTGALNEVARNKVRGGWNDAMSVLMLSGGHAASQDLTGPQQAIPSRFRWSTKSPLRTSPRRVTPTHQQTTRHLLILPQQTPTHLLILRRLILITIR